MPLIYDPITGFRVPDTSDLRAEVVADYVTAFAQPDKPPLNTDPSSPGGQLVDLTTAQIENDVNAPLLFLLNQFNPRTAEGRFQAALGAIYFIEPKTSEPTVVTCQVTGLNGTVIPQSSLVDNTDGYRLRSTTAVTIGESGTATVIFETIERSAIPIPANSVTRIITVTPGWSTVNNEAAGATGRDIESRAEFENRRRASVAANAHGTVSAIYGTLANLNGVIDVQVLENIGPNPIVKYGVTVPAHGINVCIYGGDDQDIARVIYEKKDAGCDTGGNTQIIYADPDYYNANYIWYITRPTTVNFWVRVTLSATEANNSGLVDNIKAAVYTDFLGQNEHTRETRVGLAQTVYVSRFYHAITAVDGVSNLISVEIALQNNQPSTDMEWSNVLVINGDIEPVMTTDNIIIVGV